MTDAPIHSTDVAIIGGGIIGVSTALFLAERGVAVTLCEKGRIAGEQSSRNWGWTRVMGRDPREIPLGLESLRLWKGMDARIGAETGWTECGIVYVCETEADLARQQRWLDHARNFQLSTRLLSAAEIAGVLPGFAGQAAGALYTPTDGRAEPGQATEAIARAAAASGADVRPNCAVRGLDIVGGRVAGIVTEHGRIACDRVVLAGGAWSRLFAGNAGFDMPSLLVLGSVLRTEPLDGLPTTSAAGSRYAFRRRSDGGYNIARANGSISDITPDSFRQFATFLPSLMRGWREVRLRFGQRFFEEWRTRRHWAMDETTPFEAVRVLDPAPSARVLAEGRAALTGAFPGFAEMRVAATWGGYMDVTPDEVPVISPVDRLPGLFVASGFSGHGFGIGPGAGRLVADLVTGAPPVVDPAPYALARFAR